MLLWSVDIDHSGLGNGGLARDATAASAASDRAPVPLLLLCPCLAACSKPLFLWKGNAKQAHRGRESPATAVSRSPLEPAGAPR